MRPTAAAAARGARHPPARSASPKDERSFSRHEDAQRLRADLEDERQLHGVDLAVGGDEEPRVAALDAKARDGGGLEVLAGEERADQRAQREEEETEPSGAVREVERERAGVEPLAQSDGEALHLVDVVADEDERRAAMVLVPVDGERQVEEWMMAQHRVHRPKHGAPLAASEPALLLLAPVHHRRVEADARVVDEHAAV